MKTKTTLLLAGILLATLCNSFGQTTFTRITGQPLVTESGYYNGCAWGDYNGDGFPDLFVVGTTNTQPHTLWRNNGDGTFTKSSFLFESGPSFSAAWGDYNNDGYPDLFVANGSEQLARINNLWRNNGDGTFTKITQGPVVTLIAKSVAGSWADYDKDGYLDLFVANAFGSVNFLYHNNGDGTFTRVLTGPVATDFGDSSCGVWGDYDNDGYLDLFVANTFSQNDFLYHNNGDGTFTKITTGPLVNESGDGQACAWGDYDNDGWLDLFVASALNNQQDFLYHNNGDGTFTRVLSGDIVSDTHGISGGCAWADYNRDGFLDLFVANGTLSASPQTSFLYRNDANSNHWISVKGIGGAANRSAIGARVQVASVIGGTVRWQMREIPGGSFFSQDSQEAKFGLGDATNILTLRVAWPGGVTQEWQNVAVDQFLTITEPPRLQAMERSPGVAFQFRLTGGAGFRYSLETSSNLTAWTPWTSVTNTSRTITISDASATNSTRRFYRAVMQ